MHLLDSNILIYAAQPGHEFLDHWLTSEAAQVSAVSIPEVLGYPSLSPGDEAVFEEWFARLSVHDVTLPILRRADAASLTPASCNGTERSEIARLTVRATARAIATVECVPKSQTWERGWFSKAAAPAWSL